MVYPAGGALDITARLLAKYAEKASGDRILVNNRTGGAGMVGHTYLATGAKPDGYTVGILVNLVWGDAMLRANGRWAYTDLEPIAYINSDPLTWVASTEGPYKGMTAKQIIQIAHDKPGTVRIAVVPGSMWEYLVEQIENSTGAKFLRVPFQGGGPGVTALLGGSVDVAQGFFSEFRGYVDAGKSRADRPRQRPAHHLPEKHPDLQRDLRFEGVRLEHHPLRRGAQGHAGGPQERISPRACRPR